MAMFAAFEWVLLFVAFEWVLLNGGERRKFATSDYDVIIEVRA